MHVEIKDCHLVGHKYVKISNHPFGGWNDIMSSYVWFSGIVPDDMAEEMRKRYA